MSKKKKTPYEESMLELMAMRFKLLAEPVRLKLLHALCEQELNVNELCDRMDCSQANISKHLALLYRSGILSRRKQGLNVYYGIADPSIFGLCDVVCDRLIRQAEDDRLRMKRIKR